MDTIECVIFIIIFAILSFLCGRDWETGNVLKYTANGGYYEITSDKRIYCTVENLTWPSEMGK